MRFFGLRWPVLSEFFLIASRIVINFVFATSTVAVVTLWALAYLPVLSGFPEDIPSFQRGLFVDGSPVGGRGTEFLEVEFTAIVFRDVLLFAMLRFMLLMPGCRDHAWECIC